MALNLLSNMSRVETPIIWVTIGDYIFGAYNKDIKRIIDSAGVYREAVTIYPNFMKSITVEKVNGIINSYSIQMVYAIRNGDDPNLLDKVFASVGYGGNIYLTYGDATVPSYIYKEEEAIITKITQNLNVSNSTITYNISCTSSAVSLNAGNLSFGKVHMKPSDMIKKLLKDPSYGLQDIFYGMRDYDLVISKNLIAGDDKAVDIEAQTFITILDYLKYLVACMTSTVSSDSATLNNDRYTLVIVDDITQVYNGPYFKVVRVSPNDYAPDSLDAYDLEIGTHSKDQIINFTLDDDELYPVLYSYSEDLNLPNYIYRIDNNGKMSYDYSPALTNSERLMKTTQADKTWWTTVTQYPINATVTIKGLLRPATLMSYVKLGVYFYGRKHTASGLYIITKQVDTISESGCQTVLSLTRVGGSDAD